MNDLGKPDAGEPPVRFAEEALETGAALGWDDLGTGSKGPGKRSSTRGFPTGDHASYRASALLYPTYRCKSRAPTTCCRDTARGRGPLR